MYLTTPFPKKSDFNNNWKELIFNTCLLKLKIYNDILLLLLLFIIIIILTTPHLREVNFN